MSKMEFKLDKDGVRNLLHSEGLSKHLYSVASSKVNTASGSYDVEKKYGRTRTYIRISPADKATYYRNLKNNELIKAVGV